MAISDFLIWWPLAGVAMMRPLGLLLFLPVFNPATLGGRLIRNALALLCIIPILPLLLPTSVPDPMHASFAYFCLLVSELFIGMLMGFSAAIPFWVIDIASFMLDTARGSSIGAVFNPELREQSSTLGIFFSQTLVLLFFSLNGFQALLSGLYHSYELLPPGVTWRWSVRFVPFLLQQWQTLWVSACMFAMPALVIMVLLDLSLGLLNRSAQQLNVFFLSMPIKSVVALLIMLISIQYGFSDVLNMFSSFSQDLSLQHRIEVDDGMGVKVLKNRILD